MEKAVTAFHEFLAKEGIAAQGVLSEFFEIARARDTSLFRVLMDMRRESPEKTDELLKKTSEWLKCDYYSIKDDVPLVKLPDNVGRDVFLHTKVVPLESIKKVVGGEDILALAASDPFDLFVRDVISNEFPDNRLVWHMIHPELVDKAMKQIKALNREDRQEDVLVVDFTRDAAEALTTRVDKAPVPEMINWFIYRALESRASDIHIEPGEKTMSVRFRIDGVLMEEVSLSMELHPELVSRIKILTEMNLAEKRMPQDGRFGVKVRDKGLDLRVSTFPTLNGEKVVMRLLEKDALQPSLENIGFSGKNLEQFKRALKNPLGMIIISGPTGSGKTTTLYSALSTLNLAEINAVTIEDPIEYRLEGAQQLQVKEKIGLTFAAALRNILRQDPDVIMVGEIRDVETAQIAVRAALTGHVVLSTLHTNNAVGVVTRMLDMGIEGFLLRAALTMVMSQRLVRLICDKCRESVSGRVVMERLLAKNVMVERINELGLVIEPEGFYDMGRGCRSCRDTGYQGRHAVIEAIELDDVMKEIINTKPFDEAKLRQAAKDGGMVSLIEHGQSLVADGRTTHEEIIRVLGEY